MKKILFIIVSTVAISSAIAGTDYGNIICTKSADCINDVDTSAPNFEEAFGKCKEEGQVCKNYSGTIETSRGERQAFHPSNPSYVKCTQDNPGLDQDTLSFSKCVHEAEAIRFNKPIPIDRTPEPKKTLAPVAKPTCSASALDACDSKAQCEDNKGQWVNNSCTKAPTEVAAQQCPDKSVPDAKQPSQCKCPDGTLLDNGNSEQKCKSSCNAQKNQIFDESNKTCSCDSEKGFVKQEGTASNKLMCVQKTTSQNENISALACLNDIKSRVTSCQNRVNTTVATCDKNSHEDSLSDVERLIKAAAGSVTSSAFSGCTDAGISSQAGWYAYDKIKKECDTQLNVCKSSCDGLADQIESNRTALINKCRSMAQGSSMMEGPPTLESLRAIDTEVNRQIDELKSTVTQSYAQCQSGDAVTNKAALQNEMNSLNSISKDANKCQCQLRSASGDCSQAVGPADCAANPNLPGCAQASLNCLNSNSQQCACFKNPGSDACKALRVTNGSEVSGMAAIDDTTAAQPTTTSSTGSEDSQYTDSSDMNLDGLNNIASKDGVSTTTETNNADGSSPFGVASAGGGMGGAGGNPAAGSASQAPTTAAENSNDKSAFGGLLQSIKSAALGALGIKKNESTANYSDSKNGAQNGININSYRPGIRGIASIRPDGIHGPEGDIFDKMKYRYRVNDKNDKFLP